MSKTEFVDHSLTDNELAYIEKSLNRKPNKIELSMIDAQWSEHCSYKSSKSLLKLLPTKGKRVLFGPGYEAGVLDVDNGQVLTMHIESHNHPSAIDPYGGAATGVGGVLRDILSIGTRPIAVLDSLRFGNLTNPNNRWLLQNVVRGIADYGNCVGIPTIGGELSFDNCYDTNCLVDVVSIGVGKKKQLIFSEAKNVGDILVLLGNSTGRDGIHGSSFASKDLEGTPTDRSAVQIPDPFIKKLIIEGTMDALSTGLVSGLKDLGGGGLACCLSEVSDMGQTGVEVDLEKIHLRESGMEPYEVLISESQERMLFIINPDNLDTISQCFDKYSLQYSIIGKVTDTKHVVITSDNQVIVDLPTKLIANAPLIHWPKTKPKYLDGRSTSKPELPADIKETILKVLSSPNLANKSWVFQQYDHEVGTNTIVKPGESGSSVIRIAPDKFIAISVDGNPSHCYLDPYNGSAGVVAEAMRNVISVGAEPIAMLDHLQFGNPSNSDVFWTFNETIKSISDFCSYIGIPCVGGKVSFYNEDAKTHEAIKPSPVISVAGLIKGEHNLRTRKFNSSRPLIVVVGETFDELGGSEYYSSLGFEQLGTAPKLNFELEKRAQKLVRDGIKVGLFGAVNDCSKGGLIHSLLQMCTVSDMGASIDLSSIPSNCKRWDELLFSESHSRFLATIKKENFNNLINISRNHDIPVSIIGSIGGHELQVFNKDDTLFSCDLDYMRSYVYASLNKLMDGQI
uniref:Phosphoribosylformylglycinamidine synthase subunit PurL n=1 Tax=uncultured marine thaumarchaeote KM3_10_C07 TaxID=1455986 RepID=A0A075G7M1_9ARCH|nr:phosphoribosylformylglycinamidine synthase II (purL) [uncultured marine thaumarchaeote KM3_10_C07]